MKDLTDWQSVYDICAISNLRHRVHGLFSHNDTRILCRLHIEAVHDLQDRSTSRTTILVVAKDTGRKY